MHRWPFAAMPLLVAPLLAQAPGITPAGDPSVKSDTIYRLAVDPTAYPNDPYIYLLDDGVIRVEADGRTTRTYRQVVQILNQDGVDDWAEQSFSYDAGRERLRINWIRVVKPDGTVISDGPSHEQESLSPVALSAPVYSSSKVRRLTLAGVAPGTIVDYSYTTERFQPPLPGDFYSGWSVHTARFTRRSRLLLDVPIGMHPRIQERNLRSRPRVVEARGRRVYTWAAQDVPRIEREPFAGSPDTVYSGIDAAGTVTWADIARWYAGLARDRSALTPGLERKLAELLLGAHSLEDSIKAVHRWVAQDIRYVSLSLGLGGYQPREPGAVFETGYGDCKDKATLFIALLGRMGITAYPVLLSSSGDADSTLPSISQFDHMIAAMAPPGGSGDYRFVDLTASLAPLGVLPPAEQGSFAVVVHLDGRAETVTLPESPVTANANVARLEGDLTADGAFNGYLDQRVTGARQFSLRDEFSSPIDSVQRTRLARSIASALFPGGSGDSLVLFDGRDLAAEPRMAVAIHNGRAATTSGASVILTLPIRTYTLQSVADELRARGPRRFPISAAAVSGEGVDEEDLDLVLPEGWHADLPTNVAAASDFGRYESRYSQEGRVLHVMRRLTGARGTYPPDRVGDLIAWLEAVSKDDAKYLVIHRGP
jgi:transglutaminase-like putative cysteine protease